MGTKEIKDRAGNLLAKGLRSEATDLLVDAARQLDIDERIDILMSAVKVIEPADPRRAYSLLAEIIELRPNYADAHLGAAVVLSNLGDHIRSARHLESCLKGELTLENKPLAAVMLSRYGLGAKALAFAKESFAHIEDKVATAGNCLDIALSVADWDFSEQLTQILEAAYLRGEYQQSNESAKTNILWNTDELTNVRIASLWSRKNFPHVTTGNSWGPRKPGKLRVGYLSSDFRRHPTAYLINGLLRNHDKENFEIFVYCSGWDDGSEIRREILKNSDFYRSVSDLSDASAADLIRSDDLDILVELNGVTKANRLGILCHRPAPVQLCYLGWPGTVGGRFADYIVADDYILGEEKSSLYPEQIVWLPDTYQINDYQSQPDLPIRAKEDFGFNSSDLVVGMFNSINKVQREVWDCWMRILIKVPSAKLWLLDPGNDAMENLAAETLRLGVELDRIVIAPRVDFREHLERLQVCDLALDPWPIGGHTTAADTLFAGVPLLAMEGTTYASRVNGSLLRAAGLEQLVTRNRDEYVRLAITLLENQQHLAMVKKLIGESIRGKPLFNASEKTKFMEKAYSALSKNSRVSAPGEQKSPVIALKKMHICILSPSNYSHSSAYDELAAQICYAARELGYDVNVKKNEFYRDRLNIILGAQHLPKTERGKLPPNAVVFNTEQLQACNSAWRDNILQVDSRVRFWDYSDRNIDTLSREGRSNIFKFEFGYQRQLDRIVQAREKDIDVLFYGSISTRRQEALGLIERAGVRVKRLFNVYGRERDSYISRARLVLNLHAYEDQILEIVRISYLMINGIAVVSEKNQNTECNEALSTGICCAPVEALPAELTRLLAEPLLVRDLEFRSREVIQRRSQSSLMRGLLQ